jgi:hypothetical protein
LRSVRFATIGKGAHRLVLGVGAAADANLLHIGIKDQIAVTTGRDTIVHDQVDHHKLGIVAALLRTEGDVFTNIGRFCEERPDAVN